jgi:AcrR family transcriptional regulator
MTRTKAIPDSEVLAVARKVFSAAGHVAATRDVAKAAGLSEAVLYQRFGSKDALFFAAMRPEPPDLIEIFGSQEPTEDAERYLRRTVGRMGSYFAEVVPLVMRILAHPSFVMEEFTQAKPLSVASQIEAELRKRLLILQENKLLNDVGVGDAAHVLTSLAHDWGLRGSISTKSAEQRRRELDRSVVVVLRGIGARAE